MGTSFMTGARPRGARDCRRASLKILGASRWVLPPLLASLSVAAVAVYHLVVPGPVRAQSGPWSDSLLPRLRAAATMVPGPAPMAVRVMRFGPMSLPESYFLQDGTARTIPATYTVFQLRFADGWIMVDAGMDPEVSGDSSAAYRAAHEVVQRALRGARTIVVTHEHHDHVAGVIRSPALRMIAPKTLLNRAQVRTLQDRPNVPQIRLDSVSAGAYLVVDFDFLLPLTPGVVLVRAPGHTPGSQLVYVRLDSGKEVLLIGDVAWSMAGVEQRRQKPDSISKDIGEDSAAIQAELDWLNRVNSTTSVAIANSHDDRWLKELIRRGALVEGLDLRE